MLASVVLLGFIIYIIEGMPLMKKKQWKELATVVFLIFIAIFLTIIKSVDISNPLNVLDHLINPFGRKIFRT